MIKITLKGEDSSRRIQAELKLRFKRRRVQQVARGVPYVKYKKNYGTANDRSTQRKQIEVELKIYRPRRMFLKYCYL